MNDPDVKTRIQEANVASNIDKTDVSLHQDAEGTANRESIDDKLQEDATSNIDNSAVKEQEDVQDTDSKQEIKKEASEKEAAERKASEKEASQKEAADKEAAEKEAAENQIISELVLKATEIGFKTSPEQVKAAGIASFSKSMDNFEGTEESQISSLKERASFIGFKVSKAQIKAVGIDTFFKHLKNQEKISHRILILEQKSTLLGLKFRRPPLPLAKGDLKQLERPINRFVRKALQDNSDGASVDGPRKRLEHVLTIRLEEIGFDYKGLSMEEMLEQGVEQLAMHAQQKYLFKQAKKHQIAADLLEVDFSQEAVSWERLNHLKNLILCKKLSQDLDELLQTVAEETGWTPLRPPQGCAYEVLQAFWHQVAFQKKIFSNFAQQLAVVPEKKRLGFTLPSPPLKAEEIRDFEEEIKQFVAQEHQRKQNLQRILSLVRIGVAVVTASSLATWQLRLAMESVELKSRAAKLGFEIKGLHFPFLPSKIDSARWRVEQQERLAPHIEAIQLQAAIKGLNLKFTPPYTDKMVSRWESALNYLNFVTVPSGSFNMGSSSGDQDELPRHKVQIGHDLLVQNTEVTQALYSAIMKSNPSTQNSCATSFLQDKSSKHKQTQADFKLAQKADVNCPVDNISWYDAIRFTNELSALSGLEPCYELKSGDVSWPEGFSCEGYRLPTEAEWEYFARSGTEFRYPGSITPTSVSWSKPKSKGFYHPVAQLDANAWKIFDLSGNVWEWCWDYYGRYGGRTAVDPLGPELGLERVRRGGDYAVQQKHATVTRRSSKNPRNADWTGTGFRIVRTRHKGK